MTECYICLDIIENNIATVSCGHEYHFDCLSEWIKKKNDWRKVCVICTDIETEILSIKNIQNTTNILPEKETDKEDNSYVSRFKNCCTIL